MLCVGLLIGALASPVLAQTAPAPTPTQTSATEEAPLAPDAIEARLAEVRAERERAPTAEVAETLEVLESLLERQLALASAERVAVEPAAPLASAPPSVAALARLYRDRALARADSAWRSTAVTDAELALAKAREIADEADRESRRAGEGGSEDEASAAQLAARLAREEVHLRTLEMAAAEEDAEGRTSVEAIEQQIEEVRQSIARGQGTPLGADRDGIELDARLVREREERERELARLELKIDSIESRFTASDGRDEGLLAAIDALRAARDSQRHAAELIDARLARLRERTPLLETWDAALRGRLEDEARDDAISRLRTRLANLAQARHRLEVQREAQDRTLRWLEDRLDDDLEPTVVEALEVQRASVRTLLREQGEAIAEIDEDRALVEGALEAIEGSRLDPATVLRRVVEQARALWRYEIASVQDSSITVGAIVIALVLISFGLFVSRRLASLLAGATQRRFRLDAGATYAIETLVFYLLAASFGLFALRVVHVPLTAFTVAGGALAIGLGFGSQNVMNNFISGLILMLERPVRAHDTVEIDGSFGTIERIGARSTQIRATDGRHMIVPNSFFLESNVVNWTLSDDLIRTTVVVGVQYGSDTRRVEQLIRRVVDEVPEVLPEPAPIILFDDFANDALVFEVLFWLEARGPLQLGKIASKVRFGIDDAFREDGIVIAFPQRDVHLDTVRPLDVRVLPADGERSES